MAWVDGLVISFQVVLLGECTSTDQNSEAKQCSKIMYMENLDCVFAVLDTCFSDPGDMQSFP